MFCLPREDWLWAQHCFSQGHSRFPIDIKGSIFGLPRALPLNHRRQGWKRLVGSHPVLSSCQRKALLHRNTSRERASCVASAPARLGITDKTHETLHSPSQTQPTNILWSKPWFLLVPAHHRAGLPKPRMGPVSFLSSCIPLDWCEISVAVPFSLFLITANIAGKTLSCTAARQKSVRSDKGNIFINCMGT